MRIIGGRFKGYKINLPKGVRIRPTKDMVKEALFNILGKKICGASFLELFAGSGNVGIEALSRGAKEVIFVENSRLCMRTIEANLKHIGMEYTYALKNLGAEKEPDVVLMHLDAEEAIKVLHRKKLEFDLVFLDPPYYRDRSHPCTASTHKGAISTLEQDQLKNCLIKIGHCGILSPHAIVIVEHHRSQILPQSFPQLKLILTKSYADTVLSFYQARSSR